MPDEFRVNTYFAQGQDRPDIAVLADGSFVIVWDSFFLETSGSVNYIAAQRFDAVGNRLGGEIIISSVALEARYPRVDALDDGGFAVIWEAAEGIAIGDAHIFTRSYDADGTARGTPQQVTPNRDEDFFGSDVVGTSAGHLVFYTGNELNGGLSLEGIFVRAFDTNGNPTGPTQQVNRVLDYDQQNARADTLSNGDVIVIWESENSGRNGAGNLVDQLRGRVYSPGGQPRAPEFVIDNDISGITNTSDVSITDISVAGLTGRRFVATWYEANTNGPGDTQFEIRGRIMNANGTADAPVFEVSTLQNAVPRNSTVSEIAGGGFVVMWNIPSPVEVWDDVFGQIFDEQGNRVGGEFLVPTVRALDQEWPSVAALPDGRFVVTYMSASVDGDEEGIAARIFDAPPGQRLFGTAANDVLQGGVRDDTLFGRDGADTLFGFGGDDVLFGGAGNDLLVGGAGMDRLIGDGGNDELRGGDLRDELFGGGGNDTLLGSGGNDLLEGGAGNDVLNGENGRDTVRYVGNANLTLNLARSDFQATGYGQDRLVSIENATGGNGADRIFGNAENNFLQGRGNADSLYGYAGNDRLAGDLGNDRQFGGLGRDFLDGGRGNDVMTGGDQWDVFVFRVGDGTDRITDFQDGVDRLLVLSGANNFGQVAVADAGANVRITFSDVTIILEGIDHTLIGAGDFNFA